MTREPPPENEDWLSLLDLSAIADPHDKVRECEYFLNLASVEIDRDRFRWTISAYFNAAYSFFESSALRAHAAFTDPNSGDPSENTNATSILRKSVHVLQNAKNPYFIKTAGLTPLTQRLYELRKGSTHHFPLSIMIAAGSLPEAFHFGHTTGQGTPALAFCRETYELIRVVQRELDEC